MLIILSHTHTTGGCWTFDGRSLTYMQVAAHGRQLVFSHALGVSGTDCICLNVLTYQAGFAT